MNDDKELLASLRNRSQDAFQTLFELYSDRMFRLRVSFLRDEDQAEEVVQDVFLRFFEKLDKFEGRSQIGTWLYRVVHNSSVDKIRRRKRSIRFNESSMSEYAEVPFPIERYYGIGGQRVARYDGTNLEYMLTDAQGLDCCRPKQHRNPPERTTLPPFSGMCAPIWTLRMKPISAIRANVKSREAS